MKYRTLWLPTSDAIMFRKHSTLFGVTGTIALILVVGQISHWSAILTVAAGLIGIAALPRLFYGFAASRALDKEQSTAPAGIGLLDHDWDSTPTEEERLEKAIQASEGFDYEGVGPDPTALERLAQEERP